MNRTERLASVRGSTDEKQLRAWIANARRRLKAVPGDDEAKEVEEVAFRRLTDILPSELPGSLEHDFWRTIHAFELTLSDERGRTVRLSRTRQKVSRVGVVKTLEDWATDTKQTDGFSMLLERRLAELTGEAIVLRHAALFAAPVVSAARRRLIDAGVEPDQLPGSS